jgi:hypothetical protein
MKTIWCGTSVANIGDEPADLVVLPEGVAEADLVGVARSRPASVVVGAWAAPDGRMRGVIWHLGREQVAYGKVRFDGRSPGGPPPVQPPVYLHEQIAIGVVVCLDVQDDLANRVLEALLRAPAPFKALCIPADMRDALVFNRSSGLRALGRCPCGAEQHPGHRRRVSPAELHYKR